MSKIKGPLSQGIIMLSLEHAELRMAVLDSRLHSLADVVVLHRSLNAI